MIVSFSDRFLLPFLSLSKETSLPEKKALMKQIQEAEFSPAQVQKVSEFSKKIYLMLADIFQPLTKERLPLTLKDKIHYLNSASAHIQTREDRIQFNFSCYCLIHNRFGTNPSQKEIETHINRQFNQIAKIDMNSLGQGADLLRRFQASIIPLADWPGLDGCNRELLREGFREIGTNLISIGKAIYSNWSAQQEWANYLKSFERLLRVSSQFSETNHLNSRASVLFSAGQFQKGLAELEQKIESDEDFFLDALSQESAELSLFVDNILNIISGPIYSNEEVRERLNHLTTDAVFTSALDGESLDEASFRAAFAQAKELPMRTLEEMSLRYSLAHLVVQGFHNKMKGPFEAKEDKTSLSLISVMQQYLFPDVSVLGGDLPASWVEVRCVMVNELIAMHPAYPFNGLNDREVLLGYEIGIFQEWKDNHLMQLERSSWKALAMKQAQLLEKRLRERVDAYLASEPEESLVKEEAIAFQKGRKRLLLNTLRFE